MSHDKVLNFPWSEMGSHWGILKDRHDRVQLYFERITVVIV